jgi:23S rRNA (uracil1939-C5)-methyltransferase
MDAPLEAETTPLAPGELVELRIDALAAGGDGVGRAPDGRVVFVPLAAPGDRIRARIVTLRSRFARGELESVLEPGPSRVEPACPVFGECGGCAWQHVDYVTQCDAKRRIVEDALRRLGRLAPTAVKFHPSPEPWGYRARARMLVQGGRIGYRRRRSHALCAVERCPVLSVPLERGLRGLRDDPPVKDGEWELSADGDGVCAHEVGGRGEAVEIAVAGASLRISPGVFYQAHAGFHDALVESVARAAGRGALALELYAGAGFFTLSLANAFERVIAIEAQAEAVEDLRHNLARADCGGVEVVGERVEAALARADLLTSRPDAIVLDPPRAGLAPEAAKRICELAPRRIAYLSCDPATLARDLAVFVEGGFGLEEVEAFDLFPQTPHVEVLAQLRATDSEATPPPA